MRKFEFTKTYEEVEIGGEVYKIDMSDEATLTYQKLYQSAVGSMEKAQKIDVEKATYEELEEVHTESKEFAKQYIDAVLGEGSFDKFYEQSPSMSSMVELMSFLVEGLEAKTEEIKQKQKSRYVKKGNK